MREHHSLHLPRMLFLVISNRNTNVHFFLDSLQSHSEPTRWWQFTSRSPLKLMRFLQVEGMRRPGISVGETSGVEISAVGASVSFDKILGAVLDNNDEVQKTVMF